MEVGYFRGYGYVYVTFMILVTHISSSQWRMSWQDTLISSHTTTWSMLITSSAERRWRRNSATSFLSFLVCMRASTFHCPSLLTRHLFLCHFEHKRRYSECWLPTFFFLYFGWTIPLSKKPATACIEMTVFVMLLYYRYDWQPRHSWQQLSAISHREATSVQQLVQSSHRGYAHRLQAAHWPCKCVCVCVCVCVRERERVCVCEWERERERG